MQGYGIAPFMSGGSLDGGSECFRDWDPCVTDPAPNPGLIPIQVAHGFIGIMGKVGIPMGGAALEAELVDM
jgi:hypothetical protein